MKPSSLTTTTIALVAGSAAAQSVSVQPSLRPSLAPAGQAVIDDVDCVAVGAAAVPGCAQECFMDGAAALGCRMHDLGCQCQQQARMMAAAESCVADFCPAVAYQSVIDGVMAMCACAVGVATAQPSATPMGLFTATATVVSSMTVVAPGSGALRSSIAPAPSSLSAAAAAAAAPSEAPPLQRPGPGGGGNQRPLVATPVTPQELQLALGIAPTKPAEAGSAPRQGMRLSLAASLVASAAVVLVVVPFL